MGCDIHTYVERRNSAGQWVCIDVPTPFAWRNYGMFGFLAGVRDYSVAPTIAEPRDLPGDVSQEVKEAHEAWGWDAHTPSWLTVRELAEFDYDQPMIDRRITRGHDGGVTGSPAEGRSTTVREFLDGAFMDDLDGLKALGAPDEVRVVFWFDN